MKLPSPQFFLFLIFSILLPTRTSSAVGSDGRTERQVRLAYVDGDVRLSRGTGKAVDLNKSWEQAQVGESVEQGFALATRNGRTEVEFEDGSAVYLAENSLLLFRELSAPRERNLTRMTLPTGTATFSLKPVSGEDFFIQTPTDTLRLSPSETLYSRVDAYLDATAITAQADKGETLIRINDPNIQIAKGQTVFLQNGETIELPGVNGSCQPTRMSSLPRHIEPWLSPPCEPEGRQTQSPAVAWDNWVSNRVKKENSVMDAALRASGLSSPIPGLVDLYEHGSFFGCDEYGTCWEPTQPGPQMDGPMQSPPPSAQSPAPSTTPTFQTHTVEWVQTWGTWCGPMLWQKVSRVARTPEELQKLLRLKELAERWSSAGNFYSTSCYTGYWFPHHGHYARVISQRYPPKCPPRGCKPVHPPRPRWVQVGRQVGFVPRHPKDVAGKPPLNLKNGIIIVPPSKPGQPIRLLAIDSSEKISVLDRAPMQFQSGLSVHPAAVTAPEIHARLALENTRQSSVAANRSLTAITYDYKSHTFTMPGSSAPGSHSKPMAVGGITSSGKIASFADGHSSAYAESFGRTSAAASYNSVGAHSSGSYYSGGGHSSGSYSGGGHSSGSNSGGGHSSGSYSSGGSSSGSSSGGYAHSSAGAASSSSSSNSGSSPSSTSTGGGGGSHH